VRGVLVRRSSSPLFEIRTGVRGRSSLSVWREASCSRMGWPETRCPKTVCLALRWVQGARVMKNLVRGGVSNCTVLGSAGDER